MIRILLADDHTLVRQGLRRILEERPEWQVVAETGNGLDAVRLAADLQPDVVILDIGMPQLNGLEAARQIAKRVPPVPTRCFASSPKRLSSPRAVPGSEPKLAQTSSSAGAVSLREYPSQDAS